MLSSTPGGLIILSLYYLLAALLTFFSVFGIYILIRYGRTVPLTLVIAVVYSLIFLKLLSESYATLKGLLS